MKKKLEPSFVGVDLSEDFPPLLGSENILPPFSAITTVPALEPIMQK